MLNVIYLAHAHYAAKATVMDIQTDPGTGRTGGPAAELQMIMHVLMDTFTNSANDQF